MYKIQYRHKDLNGKWWDEQFHTRGKLYYFKQYAINLSMALARSDPSMEYRIILADTAPEEMVNFPKSENGIILISKIQKPNNYADIKKAFQKG